MKTRGFTLIELMIAIGIFSVILLVMIGMFSRFMAIQRRDIGEQHLQEDLRLALEMFDKEGRTAFGNTFPTGLTSEIVFRNQNNACVKYRLDAGRIKRSAIPSSSLSGLGDSCDPSWSYGDELAITGPKTVVDSLHFYTVGALVDPATGKLLSQGLIQVLIKAHAQQKPDAVINFQSTVTSRQVITAPVL